MIVGIAEQRGIDQASGVGFVPGSGCDDAHDLYLSVDDGAVLDCVPAGGFGSGSVRLTGFSYAQDEEIATLAEQLGSDGLSAADQQKIQDRVNAIAATVPANDRPYGNDAVAGSGLAWLGGGMVAAAVLVVVGLGWLGLRSSWFGEPASRPQRT